jgi:hypothetical protein
MMRDPQRALAPTNPAGGSQVVVITNPLGVAGINTVVWGIGLPMTGNAPLRDLMYV